MIGNVPKREPSLVMMDIVAGMAVKCGQVFSHISVKSLGVLRSRFKRRNKRSHS